MSLVREEVLAVSVKMCRPGLLTYLGFPLKISSPFEEPKSQDHRRKQSVRRKALS